MKILEIRVYEGRNIYTHYPAIKINLDLEDLHGVWTDQVDGFTEILLENLPGLHNHSCSRGYPGGFVERLKEGTMFGHVIEHVALELQTLIGLKTIYGKTIGTSNPRVYEIIIEAGSVEGAIQAIKSAVQIVSDIINGKELDLGNEIKKVNDIFINSELGPSTKAIAEECYRRNIPVLRLGEGSLLQLGQGINQRRIQATITDKTSCIGVDTASDKSLTKQILAEAGLPVPWGDIARTEEEAIKIANKIGEAVVVKPYNGNQGKGVSLNLTTEGEIRTAFRLAQAYEEKVIVEKHIEGRHYRLLVVGDKLVAIAERIPAHVIGDGLHTIRQLIDLVNNDYNRGDEHEKPLTKIKVDPVVTTVLAKQGLFLDSVPEYGQKVMLRENANLSTGGISVDVTDKIHPDITMIAVRAAQVIGLDIAGVDLVSKNIETTLEEGEGSIIEINAAPGLRMHLYPSQGQSRNVAKDIVDYLYPKGKNSRIPVIAITGTNGKTTTTRLISHIYQKMNKTVGMTTTDGVYINDKCIMKGDTTGPISAKTVLKESHVEVAVLETARGGIIRAGLGFDWADVGIVTNISEDHLGLNGINSIEELAEVKSLVVESVSNKGTVVLNADEPLTFNLREKVSSNLILFSQIENNINIKRHLGLGGTAVFIKKGYIVVAKSSQEEKLLKVNNIPITFRGMAEHNVQNCLAAVAASIAQDLEIEVIKKGLLTFGLDSSPNSGRLQIYNFNEFKVILDYGHNYEAYHQTLKFAKCLKNKRLIGVIGIPGDRRDQDIMRLGETAASFDYIYIKEDTERRGRLPGEVAKLLSLGATRAGMSQECQCIVLNEIAAVAQALSKARRGDTIIVFYEKYDALNKLLNEYMKDKNIDNSFIKNELTNTAEIGF